MKKLVSRLRLKQLPDPTVEQSATANDSGHGLPDQPSPSTFPDGIEVLHDEPNAIVDICFVHGLTGSRTGTWKAHGQSEPWPKTLLPPALGRARIITYGYDAYVLSKPLASSNRLVDHAMNLLTDLTVDRLSCNASCRPLIFVAHSLGGLVCKEAILISRNNPNSHRREVFNQLKGIIFMGTPHKGSWMANWASIPVSALGLVKSANKSLLKVLETDDQLLESIQIRFLSLVREQREAGRHLQVACFFEELPLQRFGLVVSKESATFEGYDPVSIHANHGDMVKFSSNGENGFKRLVGELKMWTLELVSGMASMEAPGSTDTRLVGERGHTANSSKHHIPLPKNRNFVGREEVVLSLEFSLFADRECPQVALVGMGGMGKTQIALHLGYTVKNNPLKYDNCSVIWIPALSEASFMQKCQAIVDSRGIKAGFLDPREAFQVFFSSAEAGNWLLIVDNADDISVLNGSEERIGGIASFIPSSDSGRVLFTTRSREVAVQVAKNNIIELSHMSMIDAKLLLHGNLIDQIQLDDHKLVDELLQKLTFLPLAINQAVSYINTNKTSFKEYLRLFKTYQDKVELLSSTFRDINHYHSAQGAVTTTWIISFSQISATNPDAIDLLRFIACIEPKEIPKSLFPRTSSEQKMTRAIGVLLGYGFLSQREGTDIFDTHSLVHLATRLSIERQGLRQVTRQKALKHVSEVFPDDNWEARCLWSQYLPHALSLLMGGPGGASVGNDNEYSLSLEYSVGRCLLKDHRPQEAVELLKNVVQNSTKLVGDWFRLIDGQYTLALAYLQNGQVSEAIELMEHVVAASEATPIEDNRSRIEFESLLAFVYASKGQSEDETRMYLHVFKSMDNLSEDDPLQFFVGRELTFSYLVRGNIELAIELCERIVAIPITSPEDYFQRSSSQFLLAIAYRQDNRIRDAINLLEHVVTSQRNLAQDHPSLLISQRELAVTYMVNGQLEEATRLLEHVVEIKKSLAEDHPDQLLSQHQLAHIYLVRGRIHEALELLLHVATFQQSLAEDNARRLVLEYHLAVAFNETGQTKKAIGLLERLVELLRVYPDDDIDRLAPELELAIAYHKIGQVKEAVELLRHVEMNTKSLAENDPFRLACRYKLAVAYEDNGQLKETLKLLEPFVQVVSRLVPKTDSTLLGLRKWLIEIYLKNKKIKKA
ncbi:kinesin light chain, partial [Fusarium coicis]